MTNENDCVKVWRFDSAPDELQKLSPHGGDEDWLAWIPKSLVGEYYDFMDSGTSFGRCETSVHDLPDGSQVRIGAHA